MSNPRMKLAESGVIETPKAERFVALLPELVAQVARETSLSEAAVQIARELVVTLGAATARVYLTCPDRCAMHLAAAENVDPKALSHNVTLAIEDDFPAAAAARLGLLQLVAADDAMTFGRSPPVGGVALALPLFAGIETIGAVLLGFEGLFPRQCASLTPLSHSLGALIDRARLRDEVERLETSARVRRERTALIVHDLRQPLNGLLMSAGSLARQGREPEPRTIERLRTCALHLNRMISDMCDNALLESGKFDLHRAPTDLIALVNAAVQEQLPTASVSILGEIPVVEADSERVAQIVVNLLLNAAKYGGADGKAGVELVCRDGNVVVSVVNEGAGIAQDERSRVFDAHYRGRNNEAGTPGLGLGLHICRVLVEEHGGRIWTDGDGPHTRFSFSLPIEPTAPHRLFAQARVVREEPASSVRRRIMKNESKPTDAPQKSSHEASKRAEHEVEGGVAGALAGALIGAVAGPPGAIAGAVVGAVVGAVTGLAVEKGNETRAAEDEALDREIGVSGGEMGAPDLEHPPSVVGAFSGGSLGTGAGGDAAPAEGPLQTPGA